jgi:glycosyltransferase involved in cell wall biosynthesis
MRSPSGRPIRILVCSTGFLPADAFGGPPHTTFNLCKALMKAGACLKVVTTDRNGSERLDTATDCWTSFDGVPVWYGRTAPGPFLFARSAQQVIRHEMRTADCVINSGTLWSHSGLEAWRAARRLGKPAITYVRGLLDPWARQHKPWRKRFYWHLCGKRILRDSSVIVALNETERRTLLALDVTTRIQVIPNGARLEGEPAAMGRDYVDGAFPALRGRRYVLFLGRVHEKKGLDILLPAISQMLAAAHDIAFVVAGPIDPAYSPRFRALVAAHALEGRVTVCGHVSGALKAALLANGHVFVLPSYSEGLPVAVLEALLGGCPVVVSRPCNLPEVEKAGAGLVIDPDARQLVAALRLILGDEPRRRHMSECARALAREKFDWDAIGERTLSLCTQLVETRTAGGRSMVRRPLGETPHPWTTPSAQ